MNRKIALIANLSSNNSANQSRKYQEIISYFQFRKLEIAFAETKTLIELKEVVSEYLEKGFIEFVAMGGDGSLHYLVNEVLVATSAGMKINDIIFGIIPMGTGNDWLKSFDFKSREDILEGIIRGNSKKVDIGKITFQDHSVRYFVNISGMGFNGAVIQQIDRFKILGKWAYYAALIFSFFIYKGRKIRFKIDGEEYWEDTFVLTVGIGKYAGGEMLLCPDAILDDGLFDMNVIRKISKWQLMQNIFRLKDGSYLKHLDCFALRGKSIEILENEHLYVEADGEFLGKEVKSFEIVEGGMRVYDV